MTGRRHRCPRPSRFAAVSPSLRHILGHAFIQCRKFTLFRHAFCKAQGAKAKSAVFAFAREWKSPRPKRKRSSKRGRRNRRKKPRKIFRPYSNPRGSAAGFVVNSSSYQRPPPAQLRGRRFLRQRNRKRSEIPVVGPPDKIIGRNVEKPGKECQIFVAGQAARPAVFYKKVTPRG